jgi:hypothetical protein
LQASMPGHWWKDTGPSIAPPSSKRRCKGIIVKLLGASNLAQREVRWEKRFVESLRLVQVYSRRTLTCSSPPPGSPEPVGPRRYGIPYITIVTYYPENNLENFPITQIVLIAMRPVPLRGCRISSEMRHENAASYQTCGR